MQFECLWIGRSHHAAMGTDLVDRVLASGSVTLIDTSLGRPDVAACVADVAHRFDAVFVVSNDVVLDAGTGLQRLSLVLGGHRSSGRRDQYMARKRSQ